MATPSGRIGHTLRHRKHILEHLCRQAAGIRVVAAAMIGRDQRQRPAFERHIIMRAVAKGVILQFQAQRAYRGIMGNLAEADHRLQLWQRCDTRRQEGPALIDLRANRLVLRRHTAHGIGDHGALQLQSIIRPRITETTALGAAYLAGLAVGFWSGRDELTAQWVEDARFEPAMAASDRDALLHGWRRAVDRAKAWEEADA